MRLTPSQKQDLKEHLANKINQSEFNKIIIQNQGDGYSAEIQGDLFAIVGVLGHLIYDMSKESEIPVQVLGTYIALAGEMVEEISMCMEDEDNDRQNEQFTKFMDILTGKKKRGNK